MVIEIEFGVIQRNWSCDRAIGLEYERNEQ